METLVGVEGNEEGKYKECGVEKSSSSFSSPKLGADPVVYKLVRVYFYLHVKLDRLVGQCCYIV